MGQKTSRVKFISFKHVLAIQISLISEVSTSITIISHLSDS